MGTISFANSSQTLPHMPGLDGVPVRIALPGTQALLLHQALGALVYAIRGVRYAEQTGLSRATLESLLNCLQVWVDACECDSDGVIVVRDALQSSIRKFEWDLEPIQIRALRNSLEIAMLHLGQEEFSTIAGFTLAESKQLLDVLNAALLGPLRLDQPHTTVSH